MNLGGMKHTGTQLGVICVQVLRGEIALTRLTGTLRAELSESEFPDFETPLQSVRPHGRGVTPPC